MEQAERHECSLVAYRMPQHWGHAPGKGNTGRTIVESGDSHPPLAVLPFANRTVIPLAVLTGRLNRMWIVQVYIVQTLVVSPAE